MYKLYITDINLAIMNVEACIQGTNTSIGFPVDNFLV